MEQENCCCVKPGESREFTVKLKISCASDESGACTITAECCDGAEQDCCPDESK